MAEMAEWCGKRSGDNNIAFALRLCAMGEGCAAFGRRAGIIAPIAIYCLKRDLHVLKARVYTYTYISMDKSHQPSASVCIIRIYRKCLVLRRLVSRHHSNLLLRALY